jgi:hypothetical protein
VSPRRHCPLGRDDDYDRLLGGLSEALAEPERRTIPDQRLVPPLLLRVPDGSSWQPSGANLVSRSPPSQAALVSLSRPCATGSRATARRKDQLGCCWRCWTAIQRMSKKRCQTNRATISRVSAASRLLSFWPLVLGPTGKVRMGHTRSASGIPRESALVQGSAAVPVRQDVGNGCRTSFGSCAMPFSGGARCAAKMADSSVTTSIRLPLKR